MMFICKIIVAFLSINVLVVQGWDECGNDGICPDGTTCCIEQMEYHPSSSSSSSTSTTFAFCVPTVHSNLPYPDGQETGICCHDDDFRTGCPMGSECSASTTMTNKESHLRTKSDTPFIESSNNNDYYYCRPTDKTKMVDPFAFDMPRYKLCHVPSTMKSLYGFPIEVDNRNSTFHLPYYSSHGLIVSNDKNDRNKDDGNGHEKIEHAIIIIHGSLRDADDYFCTGLSLLDDDDDDDDESQNNEGNIL